MRPEMDAFAKAVVLTAVLMVAVLGVIVVLGLNEADNIVDIRSGTVQSKQAVSDQNGTYTLQLTDGETLYIYNSTLYDSVMVNQTYTFRGHIDAYKQMTIVESVETPAPTPIS
jgi:hypothetical protein